MPDSIQWFVVLFAGVCCAGLIVLVYSLWHSKWSAHSRALQKRIQHIVLSNQRINEKTLYKQRTLEASPILSWLQHNVPVLQSMEAMLLRAGMQTQVQTMIKLHLLLAVIGSLLGWLVGESFMLSLVLAVSLTLLPVLYLLHQAAQRQKKFDEKFPEALDFLSRALRAGHGLTAAIGMLADEFPGTVGLEFKTAFDEINFGLSFNQALSNMTERIQSQDLNFFVIALLIQRETGGNLAELLSGLASTVRERMKLAGMVRTISAEGKLSGMVVGALPFVLVLIIYLFNPSYISVLWTTEDGQGLVAFGLGIMTVGGLWIWRVVQIKL